VPKLRLSDELATKLGVRYCTDNELVTLMLSQKMCSRVATFEVKATLMGDLNEWMTITLDNDHASTADVKAGVEQAKGFRPAMQELFRYDESWTGTEASGGSGHTAAQEDTALVDEGFEFEGPCLLMVSVNESYAVVLEGQEEEDDCHDRMGVYERVEGKVVGERGVWQTVDGVGCFLYYYSSTKQWVVSPRDQVEANNEYGIMGVKSTATTPDQITEQWEVVNSSRGSGGAAMLKAPNLRVRVCSSVEKHAAEQRVEQQQEQALEQANQSRQLVVEGLAGHVHSLMGMYALVEGRVVNRRAVWQKQGGDGEMFLYYSTVNQWLFSDREELETGGCSGYMSLASAALTPDQIRPLEVWEVDDGAGWIATPEAQVRRQ
jgi:hypothetical protein